MAMSLDDFKKRQRGRVKAKPDPTFKKDRVLRPFELDEALASGHKDERDTADANIEESANLRELETLTSLHERGFSLSSASVTPTRDTPKFEFGDSGESILSPSNDIESNVTQTRHKRDTALCEEDAAETKALTPVSRPITPLLDTNMTQTSPRMDNLEFFERDTNVTQKLGSPLFKGDDKIKRDTNVTQNGQEAEDISSLSVQRLPDTNVTQEYSSPIEQTQPEALAKPFPKSATRHKRDTNESNVTHTGHKTSSYVTQTSHKLDTNVTPHLTQTSLVS
jgi:hypothetical protein